MANPSPPLPLSILCLLFLSTSLSIRPSGGSSEQTAAAAAFFIFGDSTVDPGNNNHLQTIPAHRADYPPYGQSGCFEAPTGRFSDGRVITDFIAEYAKLPMVPPFLQPSAKFIHGANFASGGAGILPETNHGQAIDFQTQLKSFGEVQSSLVQELGDEEAGALISEAVYFISIGSNDYLGGYMGNPKMRKAYAPDEFVGMVIGNLSLAIQELHEKGGRKFCFLSLCPLGCLPALRASNPNAKDGGCFEEVSALAQAHNNALSAVLVGMEHIFKGFKYANSNFYNWLNHRIQHPSNYGFKDGVSACCGTGPYRGIFSCGGRREVSEYQVCENPDDYVWWDAIHPTERVHEQFATTLWSGTPSTVGPYNLERLFSGSDGDEKKQTIADIVDKQNDLGFVNGVF